MGKVLTIHSYRGGTGKTFVATNIAACFSMSGKTTCLIDLDLRAPSLNTVFKYKPEFWVNDFLEGRCEIDSVLVDFGKKFGLKSKLLLGFANPDVNVARETMEKGKKWHLAAFQRITEAKQDLLGNGVEYLLFDTSPGVQYSAVNAIVTSDDVILVTTTYLSDLEGVAHLIKGVYGLLEKNASILVNRVAPEIVTTDEGVKVREWLEQKYKLDVIGLIPCYCEVLNFSGRIFEEPSSFFILEKPGHPFAKAIEKIAEKLL
jgi:MinD-like ATPase involved in chromosome partitioning or flagellar assembly